jgi:hypothetical protein
MKSLHRSILAGLALAGLPVTIPHALAHHSSAGFNSDEVVEITGTIKEFQFTNPHTWIQVIVTDAQGEQQEWSVEWGSPNSLARRGVRPSTFPPGAEVTMRLNPMTNGAPAGGFVGAKLGDGTTIGNWQE